MANANHYGDVTGNSELRRGSSNNVSVMGGMHSRSVTSNRSISEMTGEHERISSQMEAYELKMRRASELKT